MFSNPENAAKKRSVHVAVLLLAIALLIQACASSPETAPTPAEVTERQGILRVAMQPIVQLDPAFISSDPEVIVANSIYDYLVDITPQNAIAPRLARE